ncbi:MAG TPA: hypothetical protein VJS43_01630 [Candidatus Acidoferrales bacterium]|nr:hypothetical protein [Candidatus Acidoferrales bacterium]
MSLFGKKRDAQESTRGGYDGIAGESAPSATNHRLTLDLSRAMELATMLASSRASQFIEITDLLAGLYIYEWDRLASYWPEENREHVEELLQDMCQISPQRWNYWITLYDAQRKEAEPQPRWKQFGKPNRKIRRASVPVPSTSLRAAFDAAEWVSPFRDPRADSERGARDGGAIAIVTAECVLLCIAKYTSSEAGKKLAHSGLDIDQLERAVLDPKRSPLR